MWNNIKASGIIPADVKPKGKVNGDFSSFTPTYPTSDPDCWWTFNGCDKPKHPNLASDLVSCPEPNTWGLTFDDGPNCTPQCVLRLFAEEQAEGDHVLHRLQRARLAARGSTWYRRRSPHLRSHLVASVYDRFP